MSTSRVDILKDCRFYLAKLYLCTDKHFRIANYSVPFPLIYVLCVFPQTITLSLLVRYVYITKFDLNEVSTAFAICIGSSQLQLIYLSLAGNRPTTFKIMNKMQSIVDDRKTRRIKLFVCLFFFGHEICNFLGKSCYPIGTRKSSKAFKIYEQAEGLNRIMHVKIRKFVIIGQLVTYLPATLVPISYLILGVPSQEEWMLPFPVRFSTSTLSLHFTVNFDIPF